MRLHLMQPGFASVPASQIEAVPVEVLIADLAEPANDLLRRRPPVVAVVQIEPGVPQQLIVREDREISWSDMLLTGRPGGFDKCDVLMRPVQAAVMRPAPGLDSFFRKDYASVTRLSPGFHPCKLTTVGIDDHDLTRQRGCDNETRGRPSNPDRLVPYLPP